MIVGCNLDVPGIAGTPQSSVVVMTDAAWVGDVKDRRSYSGICSLGSKVLLKTRGIPCTRLIKKQNLVCLVNFMEAWAMEPGQRILKVHGDSERVADFLTKIMTPRAAHRKALGL